MGKFSRALLGGVAGMAGASREIFEDRAESKEYDRKAAILEKRERTLASFRHGLMLERDKIQAGRIDARTDKANLYKEQGMPSGKISSSGLSLSKRDLERQSAEEAEKNLSIKAFKEGQVDAAWEQEQKEIDYKSIKAKELAEIQKKQGTGKPVKRDLKVEAADKANALASVESKFVHYNPTVSLEGELKSYTFDITGKKEEDLDGLMTYADSKGFEVTRSDSTDAESGKKTMVISLGSFTPTTGLAKPQEFEKVPEEKSKLQQALSALEKNSQKKTTTPEVSDAPEAIAAPETSTTGGSNLNAKNSIGRPEEGLTSRALAAPETTESELPADPKQWKVEILDSNLNSLEQVENSIKSFKEAGGQIKQFWNHWLNPALQTAQDILLEKPYEAFDTLGNKMVNTATDYIKDTPNRGAQMVLDNKKLIITLPNGTKREMTPEEIKLYQAL